MISSACPHCRATERIGDHVDFDNLVRRLADDRSTSVYLCRKAELGLRRWCRNASRTSAATIQRLYDAGHFKKARRARANHLTRTTVQLDALFTAVRKRWPMRREHSQTERETIRRRRVQAVFEKLPQVGRMTTTARARQFLIDKDNGRGRRPITSFHWVDRARQIMLRSALTPFAKLHDAQFMLARDRTRRGPAVVREALLTALARCGPEYEFLHFDVENFYGAISHDWLERNLGIDPAVVKRQVHLGQMMLVPIGEMVTVHGTHEASRERDQRGIPQGSSLSCLVAEQVMASVIRSAAVFGRLPTFIWSDNVGVLAPRQEAGEIIEIVRTAFADHDAGPFQITITSHRATEEFKFLGISYRLADGWHPMAYIARPIASAWEIAVGSRLLHASMLEIDVVVEHVRQKEAVWGWWSGWAPLKSRLQNMAEAARAALLLQGEMEAA